MVNQLQPLTSEVKSDLQAEVDAFYEMMVDGVAAHRPKLTREAIRATEARTYLGAEAVAAGLADEVGTMETTIQRLASLHQETEATWTKYDKIERLYGKVDASRERLKDGHAAGVRAGAAAALAAGKSIMTVSLTGPGQSWVPSRERRRVFAFPFARRR